MTQQYLNNGIPLDGALVDFRGLIISKLCNDPHLEHKVIKIDREFHENESYIRWWPYLDRLKEILPTIEPKYNIQLPDLSQPHPRVAPAIAFQRYRGNLFGGIPDTSREVTRETMGSLWGYLRRGVPSPFWQDIGRGEKGQQLPSRKGCETMR